MEGYVMMIGAIAVLGFCLHIKMHPVRKTNVF